MTRVVINAAGAGTRLGKSTPKSLIRGDSPAPALVAAADHLVTNGTELVDLLAGFTEAEVRPQPATAHRSSS